MKIVWCLVAEIWSATDRIFCHFRSFFAFLPHQQHEKSKFWKKAPGDIIILHKCTKNHDHMLYCPWDKAHDTCNCCYSFWEIFSPFTPLTAQKSSKNFKKMKKTTGDIIILHMCTRNYDQMMHSSWDKVCDRRKDGWKKWHISPT